MNTPAQRTPPIPFAPRTFIGAMVVVAVLCAGGAMTLNIMADATLAKREARLATQTVIIERDTYVPVVEDPVEYPVEDVMEDVIEDTPSIITETSDEIIDPPIDEATDIIEAPEPEPEPTPASDIGALPPAPIDGLFVDTRDGRLPAIRDSDRMRPFDAYKRPFDSAAAVGRKRVSIVLVDFGLSEGLSRMALNDLPPDITVAVNPYAPAAAMWAQDSRTAGHEPWLVLPAENEFYPTNDPGPQAVLIGAAERQNLNRLYWALSQAQGYAGIVSGYNPVFFRSAADMRPVLGDVFGRGLGFVDGDTNPASQPGSMALGYKAPYAHADLWIGRPDSTAESIGAALRRLEMLAENNGHAIGFVHMAPPALDLLKNWVDSLPRKGIVLAPLSVAAAQ